MHFGKEEHRVNGSAHWMLERLKQLEPAVERSDHKVRFNESRFARSIDLRFELTRILIGPSCDDHRMTVAEEFNELFRVSGGALQFAGIGNNPIGSYNIMSILGALPGNDALVNDIVCLADIGTPCLQ